MAALTVLLCFSCGNRSSKAPESIQSNVSVENENVLRNDKITMITNNNTFVIYMAGSGTITIDWGDGSSHETHVLLEYNKDDWGEQYEYSHNYSTMASRSITVSGENIKHLYCDGNDLTNLDVSKNNKLTNLHCSKNQLTSLSVNKNTALRVLECSENPLTSLDVSNNIEMGILFCSNTKLASLDISKNTELAMLTCSNGKLTSLDLSKNTKLFFVSCGKNELTSLDVSNNINILHLYCSNNKLTSLDVSNNVALTSLHCSDNLLTSLDMTKNTKLLELSCCNNKLPTNALNALFKTLRHCVDEKGTILLCEDGADCNTSIAENKGWSVHLLVRNLLLT